MSKTGFAMFLAGATVGAAATWLCLRRYYEQIAQEEIDSVKAAFAERKPVNTNIAKNEKSNEKQKENQHKADIAKLKPDLVNYAAKLQEEGYTNYTEHSKKNTEEKKDDPMPNEPYVISPDNYGENDNYTQISLVYYAGDGVLAWYNQMKDQLSGDVAGNLQLEINKEEVKRILLVGFEDGTKEFSDDGTVITSTASDGRTLTKTFSDGFLTMTNVLKSAAGAEVARAVKTFDSDGKLISTVVTYS